jgi:hypothetical protein
MTDMRVTIRVLGSSAEVSNSLRQMVAIFGPELARIAEELPPVEGVDGLQFNPTTSHPILNERESVRASLHKASRTYHVGAAINYVEWTNCEWSTRLESFSAALLRGVESLPKSRVTPALREGLIASIVRAKERLLSQPPQQVAPVLPIYLHTDEHGKIISISFQMNGPLPAGNAVEIASQEAVKYEGTKLWGSPEQPQMFKLYMRDKGGKLLYREAWYSDKRVVEHWGECGDKGHTRDHVAPSVAEAKRIIARLKDAARTEGYKSIPRSRMATLVIEYPIAGFGTPGDVCRRHALEDHFDQLIGWLGLGHVDGGSSGSDSMEVFLVVVDFELAKSAIESATHNTDAGSFRRIYRPK